MRYRTHILNHPRIRWSTFHENKVFVTTTTYRGYSVPAGLPVHHRQSGDTLELVEPLTVSIYTDP
jgi:hypothetical protein